MRLRLVAITVLGALCAGSVTGEALASSGLDSPENGAEQTGRGSAWVARADTPLAAYYNPAALVRQASGVEVSANLMFSKSCYTRKGPDGLPVSPGQSIPGPGAEGGPPAEVCTDFHPFPNPQVAANFRIGDKFALGLFVGGPHAAGKTIWPESISYVDPEFNIEVSQPAPNRYLLVSADSLIINTTLSASYAVTDSLSLGAGFIWGVASVSFVKFAEALSPAPAPGTPPSDDFAQHQDLRATLKAADLFLPGFVLGTHWAASDRIDVAGWFKWQDSIRAKTDLTLQTSYWEGNGSKSNNPPKAGFTDEKEAGTIKVSIPLEARVGVRYHHPRSVVGQRAAWATKNDRKGVRDPMSEDLFDVELDLTYANNSAMDNLELRFRSGIPVQGTPAFVPTNGDIPHMWKDVVGFRLGGEVVPIASRLALRAGAFYETKGQDDEYLNLDFNVASKLGVSGGATLRLGPVDLALAYQHTFYGNIDNGGKGKVQALTGDATTGNSRSRQIVNGGKLSTSLNEVALSGVFRW